MLLLALGSADATSIRALVEVRDEGVVLHDAVIVEQDPRALPAFEGLSSLEVCDSAGAIVAEVRVPEPRHRSVVGVEDAVMLPSSFALVWAPWPEEARTVRLGDVSRTPRVAPPTEAVAVQESGPDTERLDIVYLGDGYTEDELEVFAEDVERVSAYLLSIDPYGAYTGLFNVWRIDEASNESGASHFDRGQSDRRDTAYGCFYGCGGIDRLLCCDDDLVLDAVLESVPGADGILVLVNDETYGGAGGFEYATSYTGNPTGSLVAAHEIGHSLVGLWDEYDYGSKWQGQDGPNCSLKSGADLPWAHWLDEDDVDAFTPCSFRDYARPTDRSCMMNTLQDDYCPVCREEAVLAIYGRLPELIVSTEPPAGPVDVLEPTTFSFEALGPDDALSVRWSIDGAEISDDAELVLESCPDRSTLTLEVRDDTDWVRVDPDGRMNGTATWQLVECAEDEGDVDPPPDIPDCGCASSPRSGWIGVAAVLLVVVPLRRRLQ